MILVGLALRLAVMSFLYQEQLDPYRDHWRFGYETGRIAKSIVEGKGFSSPLYSDTGPTAWMTPIYPLIVAGVFKLLGIYSKASAIALLSLNALISACTCIPIYFGARRCFGKATARWSGWVWTFFPYAIYFPVERIWETWLAAFLLCVLFVVTLKTESSRGFRSWVLFGLLWGIEGLTSPVALAVLPFWAGWIAYRKHRAGEPWIGKSVISAGAFLLVVSPWFVRNAVVFHRFIPFRDGFGLALRLGTKGGPDVQTVHWARYSMGPWHNEAEWQEYRQNGELAYMDHKREQALTSIRQDPGWFVIISFRRVIYIWTGFWSFDSSYLAEEPFDLPNIPLCSTLTILALAGLMWSFKERKHGAILLVFAGVAFPLVYYTTSPEEYYRRPLDPFLIIPAVYGILRWRYGPVSNEELAQTDGEVILPTSA
jgi:hypothetical protein